VDYVENSLKQSNTNVVSCEKLIKIKPFQGLNESNLMTLPFISLKRKKEPVLNRKWIKGEQEIGLRVVGGLKGVPTMYDLDCLLALFRLLIKSMDNQYMLKDNKVDFPKKINFTYRKLAKEMGFKNFGSGIKQRLEDSIKTLNETTIYSSFAFRDQEEGKYIKTFKGEQSCRILCNFKSYSVEEQKVNGEKLASPKEIEERQSVEIDKFFYNNMCSNYFKLYDHEKYIQLTRNIAKKLLLILTQWSSSYEKYITISTLYDYVGIDIPDKKTEYYYNNEFKKALEELKQVKFIQDYDFKVNEGIIFIFNVTDKIKSKGLDKYTKDEEVVSRLREIGIEWDDITKFCRLDTVSYTSALLRYIDDRYSRGLIDDLLKYTQKGLPYGKYDVKDYQIEI
jgi:hypothetical protein